MKPGNADRNAKEVNLSKKTAKDTPKDTHEKKGFESKPKQSFWNEIKAPSQEPTDKRVREVRGTNDKSSRAFIKKETTRKGGFIKEIGLNMEVAKVKNQGVAKWVWSGVRWVWSD